MKLKSGSVMVIGGLMEEISNNVDTGIPGLSSVPWLGNAFKSVNKINGKRELIIFIKATIVSTGGSYDEADRHLYEKFSDDHRPLVF
jgi:MSHA biogenesis protein MshL